MKDAVRERPILFSAPMVRAILAGRKSQTRRVVKPQPSEIGWRDGRFFDVWEDAESALGGRTTIPAPREREIRCPYGQPGDRLWVRETFCFVDDSEHDGTKWIDYRATPRYAESHPAGWDAAPEDFEALKWRPSIFMPRSASRLSLEITEVRVERLHEISRADVDAEGLTPGWDWLGAFRDLWKSINGAESWNANPWVWAISFSPLPSVAPSPIEPENEKS